MSIAVQLQSLADRWSEAEASEHSNFHPYITELCDALGVESPRPAGTGYQFEFPVKMIRRDGTETTNHVDLYKAGHFVLEAKDQEKDEPDSTLLRRAFGQARAYVAHVPANPPPYLLVLDVGNTLLVWDRWTGSYGDFNSARQISLRSLHERQDDIDLLRDIWENPSARDPGKKAAEVTREIAEKLAGLAARLEDQGHDSEEVASFLIRCVFTMFAEDIELIPELTFQGAVEASLRKPNLTTKIFESLWGAMDKGGLFGSDQLLHFNGHFFRDAEALPLTREDLGVLLEASKADWASVEPSIMGTLLVRALDPVERHRLGAQFTPSEYVQRLVRPTVEEPIRERWTQVQAEVFQLLDTNGKGARKKKTDEKTALARLREFHEWLQGLRFLDPACGSGNFLYVTLRLVKQIEAEILRAIEEIEGHPDVHLEEVGPWQFYGIEIKPWAREIAELTLWIGHFQIWRELHGRTQPPQPVLRDEGNLVCRDAVLAWDEIRIDESRASPDPTPRIPDPVTGELVPDPEATIPYREHIGAEPAEWPRADFIIGNPPYIGDKRMRLTLGDGYVDALRAAYVGLSGNLDLVMYWWHKAAEEVGSGRSKRAGLITTNSIRMLGNRSVVSAHLDEGVKIRWAAPDHPWVDEVGSAAVRVSMTVLDREDGPADLLLTPPEGDPRLIRVAKLNADLSAHADVVSSTETPLRSNEAFSWIGTMLFGNFLLTKEEAEALIQSNPRHSEVVRPYRNGRDLTKRPREVWVVDFGTRSEEEARQYPVLFDLVRTRVKPTRDSNRRRSVRERWWRFGEARPQMRDALEDLDRYIVTPMVARHRFFTFLPKRVLPDQKLVVISSPDAWILGVLSSKLHLAWALAAGGTLEDRPTYNSSLCIEPFPFPDPDQDSRDEIGRMAEALDAHRVDAMKRDDGITITRMYNVLEKLPRGIPLAKSERHVHESAACGVLLDIHTELDDLVAKAYGWPWPMDREEILARLVELHGQRVEEEQSGKVRWLRPEYQVPRVGKDIEPEALGLDLGTELEGLEEVEEVIWPSTTIEQIAAIQGFLNHHPSTLEETTRALKGASKDIVSRHLETLVLMGEAWVDPSGVHHLVGTSSV